MEYLVDILMPVYNHENYINQAIEGVLMQKVKFAYRLIIHDDASTDNTANIVREYEKKNSGNIYCIYQTTNQHSLGIPNSTFLFPKVKAKYIALCEGDDYWTDPYKLQKQVDLLEYNNDANLCFHSCKQYNNDDKTLRETGFFDKKYYSFSDFAARGCFIHTCSVMFRNSDFFLSSLSGKWITQLSGADNLFYLLLTRGAHKAIAINSYMGVYRVHSGGIWSGISQLKKNELLDNDLALYKEKLGLNSKETAYLNFQLKRIILGYLSYLIDQHRFFKNFKRPVIFFFNRIYFIFGPGYISSFLATLIYKPVKKMLLAKKGTN